MVGREKTLSQKRRGRPPTGTGALIGVRLQPDQLGALDKWIARHPDPKPSRPEAIRRMVTDHLAGERLLPSRPDLRKGRRSIKVENLNAENDGWIGAARCQSRARSAEIPPMLDHLRSAAERKWPATPAASSKFLTVGKPRSNVWAPRIDAPS